MTRSALKKLRDDEQQSAIGREIINRLLNEGEMHRVQIEREAPMVIVDYKEKAGDR